MARTEDKWQLRNGSYIEPANVLGWDILVKGTDKYINFNSISGSLGYGIRDNAGTIEFKNSAGSWTGIGTVSINSTLTGNGSAGSPLGINLSNPNTWTATQSFNAVNIAGNLAVDTNVFFVDTTNNRIGLNTDAPSYPAHFIGTGNILSLQNSVAGVGNLYFNFRTSAGTEKGYFGYGGSSDDNFTVANLMTSTMQFYNAGAMRMTIASNGNTAIDTNTLFVDAVNNRVGINNSSPLTAAHFIDTANVGGLFVDSDSSIGLSVRTIAGSARFTVNNSSSKVDVLGTNPEFNVGTYLGGNASTIRLNGEALFYHKASDGYLRIGSGDAGLGLSTYLYAGSATPRMVIMGSNGRVGIGTVSPSYPIHVAGTGLLGQFGTDPAVIGIGTPSTVGAFVGGYYTAGGNASTIYFGQNSYFSGSSWVQSNTAARSSTLLQQTGSLLYYRQSAGNATNSLGSLSMQLSDRFILYGNNSTYYSLIKFDNTAQASGRSYWFYNGALAAGNFGLYDETGGAYRMILDSSGNFGFGVNSSISARLHLVSTTEQFRSGYSASQYWNATTDSAGSTTFAAVGASPLFTFSNDVIMNGTATFNSDATFVGGNVFLNMSTLYVNGNVGLTQTLRDSSGNAIAEMTQGIITTTYY